MGLPVHRQGPDSGLWLVACLGLQQLSAAGGGSQRLADEVREGFPRRAGGMLVSPAARAAAITKDIATAPANPATSGAIREKFVSAPSAGGMFPAPRHMPR